MSPAAASEMPPLVTTSSRPPLARTTSVLPAGTCSVALSSVGGAFGLLIGAGENDRRPAGVRRRRDPGIEPDIRDGEHALPVECRSDARAAILAGGDGGRHQQHDDKRPQRPRIVDRQPRRRQAGPDVLDRGERALALHAPQASARPDPARPACRSTRSPDDGGYRFRDRGVPAPRCGSASGTRSAGRARQAPAGRTAPGRPRGRSTAATARARPTRRQGTGRRPSAAAPASARCAPRRSHTLRAAAPAQAEAGQADRGSRASSEVRNGCPTSSPCSPKSEPITAASVRHGSRRRNSHAKLRGAQAPQMRVNPIGNSVHRNVFHSPIKVLASRMRDGGRKIN